MSPLNGKASVPKYPPIARPARLHATVDVVVSATGTVECARVTERPMGLPAAVEAAVLGWRSSRCKTANPHGRPVLVYFHEVDPLGGS